MRVAIDLDGVCYEWDKTARYMLREYRGITVAALRQPATHWDTIQQAVDKADWKWLWSEGVDLGLFRYGHMVKGCRIGLQDLVDRGHKLEIVTHRPASAVNDTLDWLSLYFKDIPLHGLTILTNGEPKTQVQAHVLVDDKPDNVVRWAETERYAVLFDRPWNQEAPLFPGVKRVDGWVGVVEEVERVRRIGAGSASVRVRWDAEIRNEGRGEQASLWSEAALVEG